MGPKLCWLLRVSSLVALLGGGNAWVQSRSLSAGCPVPTAAPFLGSAAAALPPPTDPPSVIRPIDAFRCKVATQHCSFVWFGTAVVLGAASCSAAAAVAAAWAAVAGFTAVMRFPFSWVDETAHLTYVHYLAHHGRPPSAKVLWPTAFPNYLLDALGVHDAGYALAQMNFYQGFQPPAGYAPSALFLRGLETFAAGPEVTFLALRLFGVFVVGVGLFCVVRAQRRAAAFCPALDPPTAALLTAALSLSPAVVAILAPVTNDQTCVLAVGLAALAALHVVQNHKSSRAWNLLGVAGALAWLSKMTWLGIPLVALVAAFFAQPRRLKEVGLPLAALVLPWYVSNLFAYHRLTGTSAHLAALMPIINPHHTHFSPRQLLQKGFSDSFFGYFAPVGPAGWQHGLFLGLGYAIVAATGHGIYRGGVRVQQVFRTRRWPADPRVPQDAVTFLCALLTLAPLALATSITIKTGAWFIVSRYAYAGIGLLATSMALAARAARFPTALCRTFAAGLLAATLAASYQSTRSLPYSRDAAGAALVAPR